MTSERLRREVRSGDTGLAVEHLDFSVCVYIDSSVTCLKMATGERDADVTANHERPSREDKDTEGFSGKPSPEPFTIEDVYDMMGGMGLYQWLSFIIIGIISAFSAESINMNFVGGQQDHWCSVQELSNMTHDQQRWVAIPYDSDGEYEECSMFRLNYSQYSQEELLTWNRSLMVDDSTPTVDCSRGWTYDQSQFLNTITSRVSII